MKEWTRRIAAVGSAVALAGTLLVTSGGSAAAAVGDVTEYTIPTINAGPYDIVTGPDGNLWFTEASFSAGGKVSKVTTTGAFTEYTSPTAGNAPVGIAVGPDGNLWVTEFGANAIAKITTSGSFTEYTVPTASAGLQFITAGPDGNLWFVERDANKVAKVTTAGAFTEYAIPTASSNSFAITSGPDGNLWFTETNANKVAKVTTAGVFTEFSVPTSSSFPVGIVAGPDGNLWFTERGGDKVGKVTTSGVFTEYAVPTANSEPGGITQGPDGNLWFAENTGNKVARLTTSGVLTEFPTGSGTAPTFITNGPDGNVWFTDPGNNAIGAITVLPDCANAVSTPISTIASSTSQYSLHGSDGVTWQTMDAHNLTLTCTTNTNEVFVLTANADLFTGNAGYNQDLGIFVSVDGGADGLLGWKESGGYAGTFSPNAAFVQAEYVASTGHHLVFKLKWKTNKPAASATIYAGAGGGVFSPTSLIAESYLVDTVPVFSRSTSQYTLANSDGATWQSIDVANLEATATPSSAATAVLGANADLFTGKAGYNQDLGIFVSDNAGADTLVAWKESGGFAGTFSPNAAFVKATYSMTGGHSYVFKLKWKTNKNAAGATIYAGAGGGTFSPTSLMVESIASSANPYTDVSTSQYTLANSDGTTWQPVDAALNVTVAAPANTYSIVGANADLFTGNSGFNQDLGIFVSDNGGPDVLVAWKESGGFAGTFSPNAAYVQTSYPVLEFHTYVFKLKWKTNKNAPGATIYAGAGGPAPFSPTRLIVVLPGF